MVPSGTYCSIQRLHAQKRLSITLLWVSLPKILTPPEPATISSCSWDHMVYTKLGNSLNDRDFVSANNMRAEKEAGEDSPWFVDFLNEM